MSSISNELRSCRLFGQSKPFLLVQNKAYYFLITKHANIILIEKPHYYNYGYPHNPGYNTSEFFLFNKKYCKVVSVEIESQGLQNLAWVRVCFLTFCSIHSKYIMRPHVRMRCSIQFDIIFLRFIWCRFISKSAMFKAKEDEVTAVYFWRATWVGRKKKAFAFGSQHTLMLVFFFFFFKKMRRGPELKYRSEVRMQVFHLYNGNLTCGGSGLCPQIENESL